MATRGQTITNLTDIDISGLPQATQANAFRYWFDEDDNNVNTISSSSVQMLDVVDLTDGLHTIHYQVLDTNGQASYIASGLFLKMGVSIAIKASKLMFWFDDETTISDVDISQGIQMLDASILTDGLHTIHYQILCNNGQMTPTMSSMFFRMSADAETTVAKSLRYWFDDDSTTVIETNVAHGTHTLDVLNLPMGLHALHYQLIDSKGEVTAPVSRLFLKSFDKMLPDGVNHITKYQYWLNKNSRTMQTVELSNADNPYTLIALLPMQKEPIQSSLFHFEITNGQPTIYSKNIFHIRFHDARDYFKDDEKTFIDYSVKQIVEPVGELQTTQTFSKIGNNDIRWYTLQVAQGDTVAFRLSQPATLQVFAPSGNEVFKTSESASVKWDGIHTWEDGTYYVAVHDVTGSQNNMTLDYMHMDKYDVVDWDVRRVGNGGCSTITFKGNGFRDLYAVDIYSADGDTIQSVDVSHDSDAETAVTFDFSRSELGEYDAVFHFTEEDKLVSKVMTVEEAVDIELTTNVSFPSSFLRGTSTTYTIKITNKGNMTAYRVPIHIYMNTSRQENIEHIDILGLDLPPIFSGICKDSLSTEDNMWLENLQVQIGDAHYFIGQSWYNEVLQDSQYVQSATFYSDISPLGQRVITVSIRASSSIDVSVSTPKEYFSLLTPQASINQYAKRFIKRNSSLRESFCCNRERIECFANIVADVASVTDELVGLVPGCPYKTVTAAANCISGAVNQVVKASGMVFCDDNSVERNFWDNVKNVLDGISLAETISTCASRFLPSGSLKEIMKIIADGNKYTKAIDAFSLGVDGGDCIRAFLDKKPNCPPNSDDGGGISTPRPPSDPNDIYGYLSDTGSKFIADSVVRVNYTIEFENDTTFAAAAAHTIVIKDTLDSQYFDLNAFVPTDVRIGAKEVLLSESDVQSSKGVTSFVKTVDMRPEIYAIAQVEGKYIHKTGIATWTFQSLDPMTMEPTDELMQGILPVNYDGTSGIGEVMFEVGVKPGKADGAGIPNRACIVFDYEEPIITPTWTNIVDATAPTSRVVGGVQPNDSTLILKLQGEDNLSGVWRYDVYAQAGLGATWELVAENITDSLCNVHIYDGIEYGFLVQATDSAGNVERKSFEEADFQLSTVKLGDANGDGTVDALDVVLATSYYLGNDVFLNFAAADVVADGEINSLDVIAMQNIYLNATSSVKAMTPRKRIRKYKQR